MFSNQYPSFRAVQFNAMAGSGVTQKKGLSIIRAAAAQADILFGAECGHITTTEPLDLSVWHVQHNTDSWSKGGSFLAWRKNIAEVFSERLVLATPEGYGIPARYLQVARIRFIQTYRTTWPGSSYWPGDLCIVAGHAPPMRAFGAGYSNWLRWANAAKSVQPDLLGADFNRLARAVGPALDRKTRMGSTISGFATRHVVPCGLPRFFDVGSDHEAVFCRFWPAAQPVSSPQERNPNVAVDPVVPSSVTPSTAYGW